MACKKSSPNVLWTVDNTGTGNLNLIAKMVLCVYNVQCIGKSILVVVISE